MGTQRHDGQRRDDMADLRHQFASVFAGRHEHRHPTAVGAEPEAAVAVPDAPPPIDLNEYLLDPPPSPEQVARLERRRLLVRRGSIAAAAVVAVVLLAPIPGLPGASEDRPEIDAAASAQPVEAGLQDAGQLAGGIELQQRPSTSAVRLDDPAPRARQARRRPRMRSTGAAPAPSARSTAPASARAPTSSPPPAPSPPRPASPPPPARTPAPAAQPVSRPAAAPAPAPAPASHPGPSAPPVVPVM